MMDLSIYKNDTARKNGIRDKLAEVLKDALVAEFGNENVIAIPFAIEPNGGSKINGGSIAVKVGETLDKDGFSVDVVAVITSTVKGWNDILTKSGRLTLAINFDDITEAVNAEISARKKE